MEQIAELTTIVEREVADYARGGCHECRLLFSADSQRHLYSVIVVPDLPRRFPARIVVMARIAGDKVIIDEDTTDKPLFEELLRAGIPREQMVLVYAGEALPEGA